MERQIISAIIPARNEEASIARAIESVAEQLEVGEVIVVDDHSTDRTSAILDELARRLVKLKIVRAGDLPKGWTGKNHAVALGAAVATGEWLLFTDADTRHLPGSAAHALSDAAAHDADLVSYSPEQEARTFWERALIPFVYWRLSQRYRFDRVNDPYSGDAAANGQYILMRRAAYTAVGGHASVAREILEDVALAQRAKEKGFRLFFAPGQGLVQTRMYRSFGDMWEGWTKNLYPLFGGSVGEILLEIDAATPGLAVLFAGVAVWEWIVRQGWSWTAALGALLAAVFIVRPWAWYEAWLLRNRYPGGYIRYYLVGAALYTAALAASWWKNTHGVVRWKGREYARPQ